MSTAAAAAWPAEAPMTTAMIHLADRAVDALVAWGVRSIMGRSAVGCIASPTPTGMMARMSTLDESLEARLEADIRAVAECSDRAAFARIFAFYGPRVKAYLRRLGAEDAVAEDLMQDVMLAIWRRAQQFDRSRAALSTWVYTIARNKRIDALRRERRPDFDPEDPALVGDGDLAPRGDHFAEAEQTRRVVMEAVAKLPVEQAQLLRIFYFEEKPHSVIADELGLPLGTVKSRLRLALSKLRLLLNGLNA